MKKKYAIAFETKIPTINKDVSITAIVPISVSYNTEAEAIEHIIRSAKKLPDTKFYILPQYTKE